MQYNFQLQFSEEQLIWKWSNIQSNNLMEPRMRIQLVFIHGRDQQGKDPYLLKNEWIQALERGLKKSGLQLPIQTGDIKFPYYGDTLARLSAGALASDVPDVVVRGSATSEDQYLHSIVEEVCIREKIADHDIFGEGEQDIRKRGIQNWSWVQCALRAIDSRIPFGSAASIATITKDVYAYVTNAGIRDEIELGVIAAFSSQVKTIVVAHSLGTIVAYNVIRREAKSRGWTIPALVTVGSPLGIRRIRQSLSPLRFPKEVGFWFNALDRRDVVALYPLQPPHFDSGKKIENYVEVDNATPNRHGISGYLEDPVVAKKIFTALSSAEVA